MNVDDTHTDGKLADGNESEVAMSASQITDAISYTIIDPRLSYICHKIDHYSSANRYGTDLTL